MATRRPTKTSKRLKCGDTRADGFRFGGYQKRISKSGVIRRTERWYAPQTFLRIRKASAETSKEAKRKNPKKYRNHAKNWRLLNPDKSKNSKLQSKFGISIEEYKKKLARQKNGCAICTEVCGSGKSLAVDHCHESGKIRGLLCSKCNLGLGLFRDDIILLVAAKRYLTKYKKSPCKKPKRSPSKSQARSGR